MLTDVEDIFNNFTDLIIIKSNNINLLNRLCSIKNPLHFNDDFATDEELDNLEKFLDSQLVAVNEVNKFKEIIEQLPPNQAQGFVFI